LAAAILLPLIIWAGPVAAAGDPPDIPANIVLDPVTATQVTVSWDGVAEATGYDVEADGEVFDNRYNTAFVHAGLTPGTQHTYRVRAKNADGAGEWSAFQTALTAFTVPGAVGDITLHSTDTSIVATWEEATDAQWYIVDFEDVAGGIHLETDNGPGNSYVRHNLEPDSTYRITVQPVNSVGAGPWFDPVAAETMHLPTPPNLTAAADTGSVDLAWEPVDGADEYEIEVDGQPLATTADTEYTHSGLDPETMYLYRVRAADAQGYSAWSDEVSALTLPVPPGTPDIPAVIASHDMVTILWAEVPDAVAYDVELDGIVIDNAGAFKYIHDGLEAYTDHTYRVRAKTAAIEGEWSDAVTVRTLPGKPAAPGGITINTSSTSATLTWEAERGALGYDIEIYDGENTTVINNITATTYVHRRAATGEEYTYRLRTRNILGTSEWGGYIVNNSIRAAGKRGNDLNLGLTATDVVDFSGYILSVTYNPDVLEVTDLSLLTSEHETDVGAIEGTDITITYFEPGKITFVVDKFITPGEAWTGVVNSIRFVARVTGGSHIAYTVVEK